MEANQQRVDYKKEILMASLFSLSVESYVSQGQGGTTSAYTSNVTQSHHYYMNREVLSAYSSNAT